MVKSNNKVIKIIIIVVLITVVWIFKDQFAKSETYISNDPKISIDFPASWKGKYEVEEKRNSIYVYYKVNNGKQKALIFAIVRLNENGQASDGEIYDSIAINNEIDINGYKYKVGSTTDTGLPENSSEFRNYRKMKEQVSKIIKTLKIK